MRKLQSKRTNITCKTDNMMEIQLKYKENQTCKGFLDSGSLRPKP